MTWRERFVVLLVTIGTVASFVTPASSQIGAVTQLDPSVRSAGMGGASNAVFWGGDPNYWANPALLGYERGIRYEWSKTKLVPDFSDDVTFETHRYTLGAAGIGLSIAGKPSNSPGQLRLDYGLSEGTDENGNPTGTFNSFEEVHSWGAGVSLAGLVDAIGAISGSGSPEITRWVDVAAGMGEKDVDVTLNEEPTLETGGRDAGFLVRVTPIDRTSRRGSSELPIRLDVAYGWSTINHDAKLVAIPGNAVARLEKVTRNGVAARLAFGTPSSMRHNLRENGLGWLSRSFDPLLSVGFAFDHESHDTGTPSLDRDVDLVGTEIGIANVFTVRFGHVEDTVSQISGSSFGWGIGLPLGDFAGVRYDHATIPQSDDLTKPDRDGFTAYVDPIALYRATH